MFTEKEQRTAYCRVKHKQEEMYPHKFSLTHSNTKEKDGLKYTACILRLLVFVFLVGLAAFFSGCGIENFETLTEVHPPLGLEARSSNKQIILNFSAYNNEEFFAGYNVFIGIDTTEVRDQKHPLVNEESQIIPFYPMEPFYEIQEISIPVTKYTDGNNFTVGMEVFVGVAAYDAKNDRSSPTSNVTNVIINE